MEGHAFRLDDGGVDRDPVLEQDDEGEAEDAGHRHALEHEREQGRDADVLVGDEPAHRPAQQEEDHRGHVGTYPDARQELCGEDGEPRQAGDADEEVGPDQAPPRYHARGGPEPPSRVTVHGPRQRGALGELVQATDDEEQHHRAERIGEPGSVARVAEAKGDDQDGRHGRRDHCDGLGQHGGEAQRVLPQSRMGAGSSRRCSRNGRLHGAQLPLFSIWTELDCIYGPISARRKGNTSGLALSAIKPSYHPCFPAMVNAHRATRKGFVGQGHPDLSSRCRTAHYLQGQRGVHRFGRQSVPGYICESPPGGAGRRLGGEHPFGKRLVFEQQVLVEGAEPAIGVGDSDLEHPEIRIRAKRDVGQ